MVSFLRLPVRNKVYILFSPACFPHVFSYVILAVISLRFLCISHHPTPPPSLAWVTCGLLSFIPTVLHHGSSLITRVLLPCSHCVPLYVACAFLESSSHTVSPPDNLPAFLHTFPLRFPIRCTCVVCGFPPHWLHQKFPVRSTLCILRMSNSLEQLMNPRCSSSTVTSLVPLT